MEHTVTMQAREVLLQLLSAINLLTYDEYIKPLSLLGNSTIGGHTRHIIELFQQLNKGYFTGVINYDERERQVLIESNIDYAIDCIAQIVVALELPDKNLSLVSLYLGEHNIVASNYHRELLFNIEHCIHHQALIKIGFILLEKTELPADFGVAKSTLKSRYHTQG